MGRYWWRSVGLGLMLLVVGRAQPPVAITAITFPPGTVGSPYAVGLNWTGGTAPFTWSLTSGALPPGLTLNPVGSVIGTPTSGGTYSFTLKLTDGRLQSDSQAFSIIVAGPALSISTTSPLPAGLIGQSYSQTLSVTGGSPPIQWGTGAGLPAGLSINSTTGVISGTPTTSGSYTFTVQVTDAAQNTASRSFALTINSPPLTITTVPPLFSAAVGQSYAQTFTASGGKAPYNWSIISGSTGDLTLIGASGVLTGTPQSAGTLSFTIQVSDSAGGTAQQNFSITVTPPPLLLTVGASLPASRVGESYSSQKLGEASGGTPPYSYALSGSVPGLQFDSAAVTLNGTPTTSGTFNLTLQAADSGGLTASKAITLTVTPAGLGISTNRQLPDAALNVFYSQPVTATGGAPPYVWSATGLPAGLTIDSASGVIRGTPSAAGTFAIAVTVNDSALHPYSDRFTLNVKLPGLPKVTLTGLPGTVDPSQQYSLAVTLDGPFPADISGQLILTFSPDTGPTDQTIQFASGGTTTNFTIPAGSTTATSATPLSLQTGTAAGILTVSVRLQAGGLDITPSPAPSLSAQMAAAAPVIKSLQVTRSSNTVTISITGYCTAREVTQAVFAFTAASGQTLQSTASSVQIDVSKLFGNWFQDSANSQFGTQFVFTQAFSIQGDPNAVVPVSVTLTNRIGSTTAKF